jgi:hypothetical protein
MLTLIAIDYWLRKASPVMVRKKHSRAVAVPMVAVKKALADGDAQP